MTKVTIVCLALLCMGALGQYDKVADPNMSPIKKVQILLEDMKGTVEKEGKEDQEAYDKYKCWCVTNDKEKTSAIADAEASIEELTSFIESAAGKEGELKTEIATLEADIAEDTDALETATAMKEKETAEFKTDEAYMSETLAALKDAVGILKKVQLVQKGPEAAAALLQVRWKLQTIAPKYGGVMQKDLMDLLGSMGPTDEPAAFLAKAPTGAAAGAKSYNSRSGQIFGLLDAMKDEFTEDLASATSEENAAMASFQALSASKTGEINSATEQKKQKEAELADTMAKAAQAKEDLEATKNALSADSTFLMNLKKDCGVEDANYAARTKLRGEEQVAIAETIGIITSDEARDLFGKTIAFLQVDTVSGTSAMQARLQDKAMKRIMKVARKTHNWMLASLAVSVHLDAFTKVIAACDKMLAELKTQQKEESDKNEFCKTEIDTTEDNIKVSTQTKEDLDETHTQVANEIQVLTDEIANLKTEVSDMQISLKQAGEQRKQENKIFQQSVSDQRATVAVLNMALDRLKEFYGFLQTKKQAPPPKPAGFEKSGSAGGVMGMIGHIIKDAEADAAELERDENEAQADYGSFATDTGNAIEADRKSIAEKEKQFSEAEGTLSTTQQDQLATDTELTKLKELLGARHGECDYVIKYFKIRQQMRQEEMDGINEAKGILSGAGGF